MHLLISGRGSITTLHYSIAFSAISIDSRILIAALALPFFLAPYHLDKFLIV